MMKPTMIVAKDSKPNNNTLGVVLMYHRINKVPHDPWGLSVSPDNFVEHLDIINQYCSPISLSALVEGIKTKSLPHNACVVTFDDGYLDNLEYAKPLLEQSNIPATFFITTGYIDNEREFWWDELDKVFLHENLLPEYLEIKVAGKQWSWNLSLVSEYAEAQLLVDQKTNAWEAKLDTRLGVYYDVWLKLRPLNHEVRRKQIENLLEWANIPSYTRPLYRPMTAGEIKTLSMSNLFTIGAHTITHPSLPTRSHDQQFEEIFVSQHFLHDIIGQEINHFAYPHGDYTPEIIRLLEKSDFNSACTTKRQKLQYDTSAFELPRYGISDCKGESFAKQLVDWMVN